MTSSPSFLISLSLLSVLACTSARAELVEIKWSESGRFDYSAPIAARKFVEICGSLNKNQSIAWSFKAEQPVNFNIHFHEGDEVTYPAKVEGVGSASGQLKPVIDQDYCWMWSNKTETPLNLKFTLQR